MRAALSIGAFVGFLSLFGCGGSGSSNTTPPPGPAATATVLTATPNPVALGASVTLSATVSATGSGGSATVPTGSVSFYDGTTLLGTGTLTASTGSSATAAYTTSSLAAGTHSVTASYAGNTSLEASTSTAVSLAVNPATPALTTTTLTVSPNPASEGATVTATANVTSSSGTPTGSLTFFDGTTNLGTATLSSGGVATFTSSAFSAGAAHSLTAVYAGNGSFATSTSATVSLVVNAPGPPTTTLALTATPNPAAAGAIVTVTATITSGSGTPTGSITFFDGTTNIATAALNASGVAAFTTSTLSAGATHSLTALYAGNSNFATSTSPAFSLVVNAAVLTGTTTALTASPNPAVAGGTVTLTAAVTSADTTKTPTGSVSFYDGSTLLGTAALSAGSGGTASAVYTTTTLAAGATHTLTASIAANSSFSASTSSSVSLVVDASNTANATFDLSTAHQTIAGFGGAEAFYPNYLDSHPNEAQIMTALFDPVNGLGITFLRLENNYYQYTGSNASTFDTDNTKIVTGATAALGAKPTILMSSWTPPASLKSNNSVNGCTVSSNGNCTGGFGTLKQLSSGAYDYADFGQFWLNSLQAYAALNVAPDYISIQNEPDFPATYVACLFNPTDDKPYQLYGSSQTYASYGKAFDATYQAINGGTLTTVPKMVGPEAFSLNDVQPLLTQVPANELAAVAHHLYNVSSTGGNPQSQVTPMSTLASDYPTQMKWETEYFQSPGFYNAIDIHNALTVANDNVYLYWALAWPSTLSNGIATDQQGLLYIDNPFNTSSWQTTNGWTYNDAYYAMKGYSYFIRPGYIRYSATSNNADEDVSVFQSPDAKTTVIVILNVSTTATDNLTLDLSSITYTGSAVYRSSFNTPITTAGAERWNPLGAYTSAGISLPPQSEVTVVLTQ